MKQIYLLVSLLLFSIVTIAQPADCSGSRFITNTFTSEQVMGIQFGSNTTIGGNPQNLFMDIYQPVGDTSTDRPVIILAHGGSFIGGVRDDVRFLAEEYAERGFVAVTIDYRLYDIFAIIDSAAAISVIIDGVSDMKAAVRFFRQDVAENGNTYGIDTANIYVGGINAGALLALHTALVNSGDNIPQHFLDALNSDGGFQGNSSTNTQFSSAVAGVINFSGGLHVLSAINEDDVPVYSVHNQQDNIIPYTSGPIVVDLGITQISLINVHGGSGISDAATTANVENTLISVPGSEHLSYFSTDAATFQDSVIQASALFIRDVRCSQGTILSTQGLLSKNEVGFYPNPVTKGNNLLFDVPLTNVSIFSVQGVLLANFDETTELSTEGLNLGTYIIRADQGSFRITVR